MNRTSVFNKEEKLKTLTELQYNVTQKGADEPPFNNDYWNNYEEGIYVDIVSGEPLFSSKDKYDPQTGWPSFTKPLMSNSVVIKNNGLFPGITGMEVRSRNANSFLGHVFNDGPEPTGLRFCMNSASMVFIPKADLVRKGYGAFASQCIDEKDKLNA